ncbi:MAG: LysM peptidoglycan-binding domain-containing protein [Firmicutes bacterium]|nr:LysM peptidoglycan-binding domain-containing protein [Bacillota bacterium]
MYSLRRHIFIIGLVIFIITSISLTSFANNKIVQKSTGGIPVHPSFRAGQNGQVYHAGESASESPVITGPVSMDLQALNRIQAEVNKGYHLWRLDPVEVARIEGQDLGLNPKADIFILISRTGAGGFPGTTEAEVLVQHDKRAYVVRLIQPFRSELRKIWAISSIREITSPEDAATIAKKVKTSFTYWGQRGPTIATYSLASGYSMVNPRPDLSYIIQNPSATITGHTVYYVQPGDTLWAISTRQGITIYRLIQLNPNINPDMLRIGQTIIIQSNGSIHENKNHIVEPGDTLWQIAVKYEVTLRDLMVTNGITDANVIWVGQKLIIP